MFKLIGIAVEMMAGKAAETIADIVGAGPTEKKLAKVATEWVVSQFFEED